MSSRCRRIFAISSIVIACERGEPSREVAMPGDRVIAMTSDLQAGSDTTFASRNPFEGNQAALAEGERLYMWMNCAGCHGAKGGGAIGPPFRDADWIYGDDPASIFQSVQQGRPNGMPAFGVKMPAEDIWRIALYVRSLGNAARAAQGGASTPGGPTESMRRRQPGGASGGK
jgi:cytochrome c oxidase cbb3-type subunit 3